VSRVEWQRAYVLHLRPYSDSRKLVDLFSATHGRITALWRAPKKNGNPVLFAPYSASWMGAGELKTLTSLETEDLAFSLQGTSLYCGFYLNELLQRLLPQGEDAANLFVCYETTLRALSNNEIDEPLRRFEWLLIRSIGFEFSFSQEAYTNRPIISQNLYEFDVRFGFVVLPHDRPAEQAFLGADLLAIAAGQFDARLGVLLKRVFRRILANKLGRTPLRSREFFKKSERLTPQ
jgi:DNA repair protein RecO (recombination protein O)